MFEVGLYIAFEWHVSNCESVFDMKKLLAVDPKSPVTFDPKKGTWSHFLFPSGYIMVNTIERGAFTIKLASGRGSGKGPGFGGKSKGKGRH